MIVDAALSQFGNSNYKINKAVMVRDRARLVKTIRLAKETGGIIIFTLVRVRLRQLLFSEAAKQK